MPIRSDRTRWNERYRADHAPRHVNARLIQFAHLLKTGRVLDLAGGIGQNGVWLAAQSNAFRVINADASDEGLARASTEIARVAVDVGALAFPKNCFDTILNVRFFDPRIIFSEWLAPDGTIFFETFTPADAKYRSACNPVYTFPLNRIPEIFHALDILHQHETDDGAQVYVTVIARKNA